MVDDRAGEGVLGVGVHVHLDDAVVQGLADLFEERAGAAVEDEVERVLPATPGGDRVLEFLQHGRTELDVARLVHAVDVAEGGCQQVAALLTQANGLDGPDGVLGRGVQLFVDLVGDAVLLAADNTDLHLHDDLGLDALFEEFGRDPEVFGKRHRRAIPHVGLEQRVLSLGHPLLRDLHKRAHVPVELVLGAVVGVQRDGDRVFVRDDVGELSQRDGTGDHVLDTLAGEELRATSGDLDDAVALRLRETAQGGDQGLAGGYVDSRVGEFAGLRPVQHLAVYLGSCDGHTVRSLRSDSAPLPGYRAGMRMCD